MRSILLLTSLSLLTVHATSLRANMVQDNSAQCPSDDVFGGLDQAHVVFELPDEQDCTDFVLEAKAALQKSKDPRVQSLEVREKTFGCEHRPVFSYNTGKVRILPKRQEELVEFVAVRPYDDCSGKVLHASKHTHLFVVSGAFSDDALNLALVESLLRKGIQVQALSERGHEWICSMSPGHESCAESSAKVAATGSSF